MFNRSKTLVSKAKALAKKKKQAQDFLSNPKNLKLFQQVSISTARLNVLRMRMLPSRF